MTERALSVRQPWASLIICGLKTIEVRTWAPKYRGLLYIHAAKALDGIAMNRFQLESPPIGALLGTVNLVKVEPFNAVTWNKLADQHLDNGEFVPGFYAWYFEDACPLPEPIIYRGDRNLFPVILLK